MCRGIKEDGAQMITATDVRLSPRELDFCQKHDLLPFLQTAFSLIDRTFTSILDLAVELETDPETDAQAVVITARLASEPHEAVSQKRDYSEQWVGKVPPHIIGKIRLVLDIESLVN